MPKFIFLVAAMLVASPKAFAYCSEPSMWATQPDPPSTYGKPTVPFCLSSYSWSAEHTCDQWELDSYISEVESYQSDLREYVEDLAAYEETVQRYLSDAIDYVECEREELSAQLK